MYYKFILICLLLFSCKKEKYSNIDIYGHAGNGMTTQNSIYHDNSQESIQFALEKEGVFGVEIDVQLSKDGDLWVFHDMQLGDRTNKTGCVAESNFEKLKDAHYTSFHKEKLVRLKDLPLKTYSNKTLLIDVKYSNECSGQEIDVNQFIAKLSEVVAANSMVNFIVLSKSKYWINAFRNAGFVVYYEMESVAEYQSLVNLNIECDGVILKNNICTQEDVTFFHQLGKKVIIFDLRSAKSIRKAMKKQPDGLIVDDIGTALIEKN